MGIGALAAYCRVSGQKWVRKVIYKETETPLAKAVPHLKKTSARHRTLFWGSTLLHVEVHVEEVYLPL